MASAQVSDPELEEEVVEEVHDKDATQESMVEKVDVAKSVVEDKDEPFEMEDKVRGEDEEGHGGVTELATDVGARVIGDDEDDELDAEGEGANE